MRISIWNQFASNHSGSFMVVGSFKTAQSAAEAEKNLRQIVADIYQWFDRPENAQFSNLLLGAPPTAIEAQVFGKYKVPLRETLLINSEDVRHSLSFGTVSNLAYMYIAETWGIEEKHPLKDLILRLGADQAAIHHSIEGEVIWQVQYQVTCTLPDEGDCVEEIKTYLDEWTVNEYGIEPDEEDYDQYAVVYDITTDKAKMTLTVRFPGVNTHFESVYDILASCGCTDIRWQVKELSDPHEG
jgi:hypothetical protein